MQLEDQIPFPTGGGDIIPLDFQLRAGVVRRSEAPKV